MTERTRVVIVGAGPVGLTTSILLSRFGIEHVLVEKRSGISTLPRARGVMTRTVEIWSHLGLHDELASLSLPPHWCERFIYLETVTGTLIGSMSSNCMAPGSCAEFSPYDFKCCAQDQLDSMLLRRAQREASATLRFDTECTGCTERDDGVELQLVPRDGRAPYTLRAEWVIAADGGNSPMRERAGIRSIGPTSIRSFVNCHIRADLSRYTRGLESTLIWTMAPGRVGCFQPLDGKERWMCQIQIDPGEDFDHWTPERAIARMRAMLGGPDADAAPIEMLSLYPYSIASTISETLRKGRLLLVGDAAHRIPPAGGFGMNTGIQTAHNLVWKLAHVLQGHAAPRLLDSFDVERREVAARACEFGRTNLGYVGAIQAAPTLEAKRTAVQGSKQYGNWMGLDMGVHYETPGAFVPDGTSPPKLENPVVDYVPNAVPGQRAPHVWLRRGGQRVSTTQLFDREFVLLSAERSGSWSAALGAATTGRRLPIAHHAIAGGAELEPDAAAGPDRFRKLYGLDASGAVLVRPDGHVAWRCATAPADRAAALRSALAQLLD